MTSAVRGLGAAVRLGLRRLRHAIGSDDRLFAPIPGFDQASGTGLIPSRPAHFEPHQIDRVLSCGFKTVIEDQLARLTRTSLPEREMQISSIGPATVVGGQILSRTALHFMSRKRLSSRHFFEIQSIDTPVTLLNSEQGLKYFGHWLRDDCAMYEPLADRGDRLVSMERPDWPDAGVYERLFDQTWEDCAAFHTPSLTLARDIGFSADKRERLHHLRARLRTKRQAQPSGTGKVVYLARGTSGETRQVLNETALTDTLARQGVQILHPEVGDETLIDQLLDAALVITVEGSQATHAVYTLADGGALLILQPPERFYNAHLDWTQLLEMEYGIVIGTPGEAGFHIDPDEVLRMTERLLAASARPA